MKYILQFLFLYNVFCYLEIPIKYLPIYQSINSNPQDIYNSIINTKLYAELEIGTPKQNIEIPLDFCTNDFYISEPKEYFNINNKLFSEIKFYNSSKSISLFPIEDIYLDGNNFYLGEYSQDIFYFNNNTKINLEFYLPIKLKKAESGGIGLLLYSSSFNSDRTFLKCIKKKGLIDNYFWNIIYNKNNNDNISILFGNSPYDKNDEALIDIKTAQYEIENDIVKYSINIDNVIIYKNKNNIEYNLDKIEKIELNYNSGGIKLPMNLLNIYEKHFENFIKKKYCFKEELNMTKKTYFFYCKNEKIILDEIKQGFPNIKFHSKDLNYNFDLNIEDIIYIKDVCIYFLIFFENDNTNNRIIMGKPFLKKYQFYFEPDKKLIYFYSIKYIKKEKDNIIITNDNNKYTFIIIIIICAFVFVLIFVFFLLKFKLFLMKHKKIRNKVYICELEDKCEYYMGKDDKTLIINDI